MKQKTPEKEKSQTGFPKIRLWPTLIALIVFGFAIHLLASQIIDLEKSWSVIRGMIWWAFVLAILSQIISYFGSGFTLYAILDQNQQKLSVLNGTLIAMASASIGLVAGGWVAGAAATYTWMHREGQDGKTAVLAGTIPGLLNNGVLMGVAIIGTLNLFLLHDLSKTQLIEFSLVLLILSLQTVCLILAIRFPKKTTHFVIWISRRWSAIRHKPFKPEKTVAEVRQYYFALNSLRNGGWLRPLLGAVINTCFDMLTLFLIFVAVGHKVTFGVLLAGYGLPLILGKIAFFLPGGVGVIEGSMVALYNSLQVPNEISVVVILGYRLLSFWLPTISGFPVAAYLSRKHSDN
ncbi:MAG: YbhN family protein [Flexilinea sp.]